MNKASVIIPTYNRVELLEKALKKLLCQDGLHEVLVIDSNSNDGTRELIHSYKNNSNIEIKYFNVENNVSLKRNWFSCTKISQ